SMASMASSLPATGRQIAGPGHQLSPPHLSNFLGYASESDKRRIAQKQGGCDNLRAKGVTMSDRIKPSVSLLAAPETSPSLLYAVLLSGGAVYSDMTRGEPDECLLDVKIVAAEGKPFRCFGNVLVEPQISVGDVERTDIAIICDMYSPIHTPPRGRYRREIEWL